MAERRCTAELEEKLSLMHQELWQQLAAKRGLSGTWIGEGSVAFMKKVVDFVELVYTLPEVERYVGDNECF